MVSSASYTKDFSVYTVKDSTGVRLQYILKSDSSLAALDLLMNRSEVVEWPSQQAGINDLMPLIRSHRAVVYSKHPTKSNSKAFGGFTFRFGTSEASEGFAHEFCVFEYLPSNTFHRPTCHRLSPWRLKGRCVKGKLQRLLLGSAF